MFCSLSLDDVCRLWHVVKGSAAAVTWYGFDGCTTRVLPGVRRSSSPDSTTTKRSVVGSGPMLMPDN